MPIKENVDKQQLSAKAVSGVLWTAAQSFGGKLMGSAFFFFLGHLLAPEAFGLIAAASVYLAVTEMLMEQGLSKALIQREELQPAHLDTAFWMQLAAALVLCALGIAIAPWLAAQYKLPELTPLIRVILLNAPLSALSAVQESLLQRHLEFKKLAKRRLGSNLVGGIVAVAMALTGFGVWSLLAQQLISSLVGVVLLWSASSWRPGRCVRISALRDLMGFSVHLFFQQGVGVLRTRADQFIVGLFLGPAALGLYAMALRIIDVSSNLFVDTFAKYTLPLFSRLQSDDEALQGAFRTAVFVATLFSLPASVGLILAGPEIVGVVLGPKWMEVVPLLRVLALLVFCRAFATPNASVILAKGHSFFRLAVVVMHTAVSLALVLAFVRDGALAVSVVNVATAFAILPVSAWMVSRLIHVSYWHHLRALGMPLLATLVMAVAILLLRAQLASHVSPLVMLGLTAVLGATVYGATLGALSADFRQLFQQCRDWLFLRFRAKARA